jgi:hypothetical protein
MINVHLNGDVIRCPDIAAIHLRNAALKESHRICKYNYLEDDCKAWQDSLLNWQSVKKNDTCGRCMLSGSILCSGHLKQVETGNKEKSFKIDNQVYRKIASSSHYLVRESKSKTLFITLTFPQFKKKVSYHEINNYFSRFVENLRTNYNCGGYIAVREFGKNTHRVHFHLLLSIPFVPFPVLNAAWCNCIKDICSYSGSAILSDPKTRFIKNPARAMRYVCKYFAKCKNQKSSSRLIFVSNNILQKPIQMRDSSEYGFLDSFKFDYMKQTSDYTTCFRITDAKEFDRFCDKFLYPLFELSVKKRVFYAFPLDTS